MAEVMILEQSGKPVRCDGQFSSERVLPKSCKTFTNPLVLKKSSLPLADEYK